MQDNLIFLAASVLVPIALFGAALEAVEAFCSDSLGRQFIFYLWATGCVSLLAIEMTTASATLFLAVAPLWLARWYFQYRFAAHRKGLR